MHYIDVYKRQAHTREDLEKAADAIIEITKEMGII